MNRFRTTLLAGNKAPYESWTFLVIPDELAAKWGAGQKAVRGAIAGKPFRGTATRGEGVLRVPLAQDLRDQLGVRVGDTVDVTLELDSEPRPLEIPDELRAVFNDDPEVAELFGRLAPSCRRAWATYVADAKKPETRQRRARKAPAGIRAREFPR
jgi:uncharacterized protein YdeI (YjbR/CyaY-like superfamily)